MVQNLSVLRFSNVWFERLWDSHSIETIILTFKEPFGTEGRGGYFDQYGIIRDILQNHLMQVLTLLCMETPTCLEGPGAGKAIRDAKVAVLNAIRPISLSDVVLGQYEGYADDPTITNKQTNTPTFAVVRLFINTPRWHKVPIILKAGKALNERKAEMRIQFHDAPAAEFLFAGADCPRNELGTSIFPLIFVLSNLYNFSNPVDCFRSAYQRFANILF
jgi:glucose-6-phosphate 1-dehydrogenase